MKSKKLLPTFLAACSCLPISYADKNNSQPSVGTTNGMLQNPNAFQGKMNPNPAMSVSGSNNVLAPQIKSNIANPQFKPNSLNNLDQKQKNDKQSSGSVWTKAILGLAAGLGLGIVGTAYVRNKIDNSKTSPESYGFLWPLVQFSFNYCSVDRNKEFDDREDTRSPLNIQQYFLYGSLDTDRAGQYNTLFLALDKLYSEIKNSQEFKKLKIAPDKAGGKILESIYYHVIGIPEMTQDKITEKWKYKPYDANKVSADMSPNTEIKTEGYIEDDDGECLNYHATFEKKNPMISLKEWGFDKDED